MTSGHKNAIPSQRRSPGADISLWVPIGILLVVATALRLRDLGDGLWYDEIVTLVRYVRPPISVIVSTFDTRNQHLLYSILAHASLGAFGESAWALRLPAAILGVASIGALAWFGRLVTTKIEAIAAAAFLTFSYHHVWFSQNARGYTGILLATLISTGLMVKIADSPKPRWLLAAGYAVTMGLAALIHTSAALIVVGHAICWLLFVLGTGRSQRSALWVAPTAFVMTGFLALALYAPVLDDMLRALGEPSNAGAKIEWTNPLWFAAETLRGLGRGLPGGWITLAAGAAVTLTGLWSFARRQPRVAALMLVPVATTGVALLATQHNLWPRMFFFAAGFAVLLVIRGILVIAASLAPSHSEMAGAIAAGLLVAASATTVPTAWNPKQDYDGAHAFVERSRAPGDAVMVTDMTTIPYNEYRITDWKPVKNATELEAIEAVHPRTWMVVSFPPRLASSFPDLWNHVQNTYKQAGRFGGTVGGGAIIVLVRK